MILCEGYISGNVKKTMQHNFISDEGMIHPVFSLALCSVAGTPFPKNFVNVCKKILTRLYRVFVHVYIHHFDKLVEIGAVSLLMLLFRAMNVLR